MDSLAPRDAVVLGWSLGGMLALELGRRQPRHLRALILMATTPKFLAGPDWQHAPFPPHPDAVLAEVLGCLARHTGGATA